MTCGVQLVPKENSQYHVAFMSTFVNDMKSALWIYPLSGPNSLLLKFMFVFEFCMNSSWKAGFQLHILNNLLALLIIQVKANFTHVTNSVR
jgi:hypothetical protein